MIICLCKGVRDKDVRRAIRQGAHSITDLKKSTGAGTLCGACHQELKSLLHRKGQTTLHSYETSERKRHPKG